MLCKNYWKALSVLLPALVLLLALVGCDQILIDRGSTSGKGTDTGDNGDTETKTAADYRALVGDILMIKAFPDIEKVITAEDYEVAEDGTIKLIYIGKVLVEGYTKSEIEEEMESRYSKIFKDIGISVTIFRFYYISGEVRQPGRYPLIRRTKILEAVDIAGGFTDFAKESRVSITRIEEDGTVRKFKINCKKVRKGKAENVIVKPDDNIYVPKGGF